MAQGHPDAKDYPLGVLYYEAAVAQERVNGQLVTEATLMQQAIASNFNKKSAREFRKILESLGGDAE